MISIIIPAYNEEKVIGHTIDQFKNLSIPHEIIVADGRSTDRTAEIARQHTQNLVIFPADKSQNIPKNKNHGASFAKGEFVAFVDSGTTIFNPEQFFEKALKHFDDQKLVGLTVAIKVLPEVATRADRIVFGIMNFWFWFLNNVFHSGGSQGKFQMVRTGAFRQINGFREDLPASEDFDLFVRLSKIGKTRIDTSLTIYHLGRRAHAIGWPKLLFIWYRDALSLFFRGKIVSKEWTAIR